MPKQARGEVRWRDGLAITRITLRGRKRPSFELPTCKTQEQADARSALLAGLAQRFRRAGVLDSPDAVPLLEMAAAAPEGRLRGILEVADELVGGTLDLGAAHKAQTFADVAKRWTSGDLARDFPDQVRSIIQTHNIVWLDKYILPRVGTTPIDKFTLDDADGVMAALPSTLAPKTRRLIASIMVRVLNLAVYPCRLRDASPIPRGWMPRPGPRKRFAVLYPEEDRQLLACKRTSLAWRIFLGFLHREGMRRGEAAALRWRDLDLDHGTVTLDINKTNHARFWKLAPGVPEALSAWKEHRGEVGADDFVFTDSNGGPIDLNHAAERVRKALARAGVKRPDLTSTGPNKGAFNVHSFRRSFVTRNLAIGRGEDWVRQRSGHKSMELLHYRQPANALAELALGDVLPLDQAIPEFKPPRGESLPNDYPRALTDTAQHPVMSTFLPGRASGSCSGWPGRRRP